MHKKYNSLIFNIIFFTWFMGMGSVAQAANDQNDLKSLLESIHTMSADFSQVAVTQSHKTTQTASGTMMLQRPGKFRWETKEPNKQLIIANQKTIYFYDADLEQVTKRKINYQDPGNPALLLSGSTATLNQMFSITKTSDAADDVWFTLRPKTQTNMFHWIKLHFVAGAIQDMSIADNLGQQSKINFSHIKINQPISASQFIFKTPPGVDVVEE